MNRKSRKSPTVQEGDIYEVLFVDGGTFKIRYGYYEDFERDGSEPVPIYSDLEKTPIFGRKRKAHCNPYARTLLSFPPRK